MQRGSVDDKKSSGMSLDKLLGDGMDRLGMSGMNPYGAFQQTHKYPMPYHFPQYPMAASPFALNDGSLDASITDNHGYGLKYGTGTGYGNTAVETQSHYGPPMMSPKGGKLKGAALSALTLLAFLFFLNLLQNCLKDQMDTMNPTVRLFANFSCC